MVVDAKMEITMKNFIELEADSEVQSEKAFLKELREGYPNAEIEKKKEQLKEYEEEYNQLKDKDSIKAQYLDSWVFVLKEEIEEMKF